MEVIIKIILILLLALLIYLCLPEVEQEPTTEVDIARMIKVEPIPIAAAEIKTYAPSPLPTPKLEATVHKAALTEEKYTEAEKGIVAKVVNAEARGECFEGQVYVAAVVLKRYESGKFGKTIKKVAHAKHQFANSRKYTKKNMAAVEYAIDHLDEYPDNMFFFQRSKSKHWRNFEYYTRIGNHSFYIAGK